MPTISMKYPHTIFKIMEIQDVLDFDKLRQESKESAKKPSIKERIGLGNKLK